MRIVIHCNAGPQTGAGHLVRSAALAEEAVAAGHEVTVAGRLEGDLVDRHLAASGAVPLRLAPGEDLAAALESRYDGAPDVLHLDTYDDVPLPRWLLDGEGRPLLSNTEDGAFGAREADLRVDATLGAELQPAPVSRESTVWLRGARFTPLRRAVTRLRGSRPPVAERARRVLVVMGGTDPQRLAPRVLRELAGTGLALSVTVVAAPSVREECRRLAETMPDIEVRVIPPVPDLPELLAEQDLVVSAAGTTVWELCCLGVPMALVCAVENQRPGYERILAAGAAVGLAGLSSALTDAALRRDLAERAGRVVDGLGAWRVVRAWERLAAGRAATPGARPADGLRARPATAEDAGLLLDWRNDPVTRAGSHRPEEVPLADHLAWLERTLADPDRRLLVVEDAEGPAGTVRWDRLDGNAWEVSITVAPERRGRSLGRGILRAGEDHLAAAVGGPLVLVAEVHQQNAASLRLFTGAGYLPDLPADGRGVLTFARQLSR